MFHEYDLVRLKEPLESFDLTIDMIGTIVMVYPEPGIYEVEFVDDKGNTLALLTLQEDALMRVYGANRP